MIDKLLFLIYNQCIQNQQTDIQKGDIHYAKIYNFNRLREHSN